MAGYRNLPHVLASAAFFGRPEVEILDETPGVCRVVDCDTRISSDTVFVTFGKVSSNIDHIPFGYPFLTRQGFRHIHVAQVRRTSYQLLDLAGFAERIAPLVAGYRHRFTYGASLGGYAALYYGTQIGAQAIAGSPWLPLHPENRQFEGREWQPGSHWDEGPYLHRPFAELDTTGMPAPMILFDLADVVDSNFIQHCIAPYFARLTLLHIRGSRHGSLMQLQKEGMLKQMISDLIATARRKG